MNTQYFRRQAGGDDVPSGRGGAGVRRPDGRAEGHVQAGDGRAVRDLRRRQEEDASPGKLASGL